LDQGNLFSYLSAFVTIVLGVAMADMIHSTHRLIRARAKVKWDALPLVFAAIVVLFLITEFFSLWTRFDVAEVSMLRLLWLLATPTVFAFLAYSALPDEVPPEGLDLTEFYFSQRRLWAVMYAAGALLDLMRSLEYVVLEGVAPRTADLVPALFTLLMLAGPALMFVSSSRRANWIGVLWLVPFVALAVMDDAIAA
jgi:hypothetical protein